jgi:hypothetical protein
MSDAVLTLTAPIAVEVLAGKRPLLPDSYVIAGYNASGEFFCVAKKLDDEEIASCCDKVATILADRAK